MNHPGRRRRGTVGGDDAAIDDDAADVIAVAQRRVELVTNVAQVSFFAAARLLSLAMLLLTLTPFSSIYLLYESTTATTTTGSGPDGSGGITTYYFGTPGPGMMTASVGFGGAATTTMAQQQQQQQQQHGRRHQQAQPRPQGPSSATSGVAAITKDNEDLSRIFGANQHPQGSERGTDDPMTSPSSPPTPSVPSPASPSDTNLGSSLSQSPPPPVSFAGAVDGAANEHHEPGKEEDNTQDEQTATTTSLTGVLNNPNASFEEIWTALFMERWSPQYHDNPFVLAYFPTAMYTNLYGMDIHRTIQEEQKIHHIKIILPWLVSFVLGVVVPTCLSIWSFFRHRRQRVHTTQKRERRFAKTVQILKSYTKQLDEHDRVGGGTSTTSTSGRRQPPCYGDKSGTTFDNPIVVDDNENEDDDGDASLEGFSHHQVDNDFFDDDDHHSTLSWRLPLPGVSLQNYNPESSSCKNACESNTNNSSRIVMSACAICLNHYDIDEQVTWSPNPQCVHVFHEACILSWLLRSCQNNQNNSRRNIFVAAAPAPTSTARASGADASTTADRNDHNPSHGMRDQLCPCCRQSFVCA